jgi:hypothetical protein
MKKLFFTMFIFIWIIYSLFGDIPPTFQFIKTIGDDRLTHTLFKISDAIITPNKDIYIVDSSEMFIAKYDWDGNFIKRIGQKGQGPKDFVMPHSLNLFKEKLFLNDAGNRRIAIMDLDLNNVSYLRIINELGIRDFTIINEEQILIVALNMSNPKDKMMIINRKGEIKHSFFKENQFTLKDPKTNEERISDIWNRMNSLPIFTLNNSKTKIYMSFEEVEDAVFLYEYNMEGKKINKFKYKIDEKYKVEHSSTSYRASMNIEKHLAFVKGIYFLKNKIVLIFGTMHMKNMKKLNQQNTIWIINQEGKIETKIKIRNTGLRPFYCSDEGYLLCKDYDSDFEKLYIFKIEI